jgi:hypothetical protein
MNNSKGIRPLLASVLMSLTFILCNLLLGVVGLAFTSILWALEN